MLQELYSRRKDTKVVPHSNVVMSLTRIDSVKDNRVLSRVVYREKRVSDDSKQFNVYDFSISSIMATGSMNLLKPVYFENHDIGAFSQQIDNVSTSLDVAINGAVNNNA